MTLPAGPFEVILADPPWHFQNYSHGDKTHGAASAHYNTMTMKEIAALPVSQMAWKDAALFLWVVQPMLPEALELIEAWGFKFKTVAFAWVKIKGGQHRLFYTGEDVRMGLGYHTRAGMEQCWLATRGNGYERLSKGEAQVIFSPLREHSRKPPEIHESIERLVGNVPKVELFARAPREGWVTWGNETTKFAAA